MSKVPAKPIPTSYQRIVLLNPTRYLGNLLIAGGLIQDFYAHCQTRGIRFLLVVDASYEDLLKDSLPEDALLFYPRRRIRHGSLREKISAYLGCLSAVRRFRADIAFNIEEDSVSHRLTQLSGARFKLGSSPHRNRSGYDQVLDIDYRKRSPERKHRWYGYADVFIQLGMPVGQPAYIQLKVPQPSSGLLEKLETAGVDLNQALIVIHASAAKDYKRWPAAYFAKLVHLLKLQNLPVVLIGAGAADQAANDAVKRELQNLSPDYDIPDLCDQLSLAELAILFTQVRGMVGNDSGPFHLASALNLPGCVIFGPTDISLWPPLSKESLVLKSDFRCAPECTRTGCIHENRCLKATKPEAVLASLMKLI